MVKLERTQDYFLINGVPYSRGRYRVRIIGVLVGIAEIGNNLFIVDSTIFSDWEDATDTPYASLAALQADLRLSLFISGI